MSSTRRLTAPQGRESDGVHDLARSNRDQRCDRVSSLARIDPEVVQYFDNFAFALADSLDHLRLQTRPV